MSLMVLMKLLSQSILDMCNCILSDVIVCTNNQSISVTSVAHLIYQNKTTDYIITLCFILNRILHEETHIQCTN